MILYHAYFILYIFIILLLRYNPGKLNLSYGVRTKYPTFESYNSTQSLFETKIPPKKSIERSRQKTRRRNERNDDKTGNKIVRRSERRCQTMKDTCCWNRIIKIEYWNNRVSEGENEQNKREREREGENKREGVKGRGSRRAGRKTGMEWKAAEYASAEHILPSRNARGRMQLGFRVKDDSTERAPRASFALTTFQSGGSFAPQPPISPGTLTPKWRWNFRRVVTRSEFLLSFLFLFEYDKRKNFTRAKIIQMPARIFEKMVHNNNNNNLKPIYLLLVKGLENQHFYLQFWKHNLSFKKSKIYIMCYTY